MHIGSQILQTHDIHQRYMRKRARMMAKHSFRRASRGSPLRPLLHRILTQCCKSEQTDVMQHSRKRPACTILAGAFGSEYSRSSLKWRARASHRALLCCACTSDDPAQAISMTSSKSCMLVALEDMHVDATHKPEHSSVSLALLVSLVS
jgi:hypothetical protein